MRLLALALLFPLACSMSRAADDYVPGPDSKPQDGVPKGEVTKLAFNKSKIFPGTTRDYWVYVPGNTTRHTGVRARQSGRRPVQGAGGVSTNLVREYGDAGHDRRVRHARTGLAAKTRRPGALDRFNRSYEYDGLGDSTRDFVLEELLPEVERRKPPTGGDPSLEERRQRPCSIAGSTAATVAAFTAAWERPDAFSRVFSTHRHVRGPARRQRLSHADPQNKPKRSGTPAGRQQSTPTHGEETGGWPTRRWIAALKFADTRSNARLG